jgi:N,N'-diacetyllegionaminate synthase
MIKIIAEIGVNHNGSLLKAKKLIKIAKDCGADYAKFQIYNPNEIVTSYATKTKYQTFTGNKQNQKEMLKKYYFDEKKIKSVYSYCNKIGIKFLASIFDVKSLDLLKRFKVDFIKLPSSEITNYFLIKKIKKFKAMPLVFSIGMASNKEVLDLNKILKFPKKKLIPMYCVSSYPTKIEEIDLSRIQFLKKNFFRYGFSDHTVSNETSILSAAYGCCIIEKHLTYDNSAQGPDHKASLNPLAFKLFVASIRNTELLLKKNKKKNFEKHNLKYVRKFLVAKKDINKNEKFSSDNLAAKRTGKIGFSPILLNKLIGRRARKKFMKDEIIKL